MEVKIKKARELGFCFGVRRAIKIIDDATKKYPSICTLGPIVHNKTVVNRLAESGVQVIKEINKVNSRAIAITSHGISPDLIAKLTLKEIEVVDTTCPTVRSAQRAAKKLSENGFGVIIYGESAHPEVKGLLGWAGKNAIATLDAKDPAINKLPRKVGILSQTTQTKLQFGQFVNDVIQASFPRISEIRIINTLCGETQKRQDAALELAEKSDLMIVVGGQNSANTKRLAELCTPFAETHFIETADEIKQVWIKGKKHIGVTAGASTPDEAIAEVLARLKLLVRKSSN
jgi:4-hydroxy-3-methylbut-2-en-1-yl diphosphate reductase